MAAIIVTRFILGCPLKSMPQHQPKLHEKLQRIVKRATAYRKMALISKLCIQLIQCKMPVDTVNSIQYRISLWSFAIIVQFQVISQYLV